MEKSESGSTSAKDIRDAVDTNAQGVHRWGNLRRPIQSAPFPPDQRRQPRTEIFGGTIRTISAHRSNSGHRWDQGIRNNAGTVIPDAPVVARGPQEHLERLPLILTGQFGMGIASMLCLFYALQPHGLSDRWVSEAIIVVMLVRLGAAIYSRYGTLFSDCSVSRRLIVALADEAKLNICFLAAAYATQWPLTLNAAALFVLCNLAAQTGIHVARSAVDRHHLRKQQPSGHSQYCRRMVIVGTGPRARAFADRILAKPELDATIIGFADYRRTALWRYRDIPLLGHPDILQSVLATNHVDALVITLEPEGFGQSSSLFQAAQRMGVNVCVPADLYPATNCPARIIHLDDFPVIVYRATPDAIISRLLKNGVDRLGALAGLILSVPILLISAILIRLDGSGPIFFRQIRSGLNGRRFTMYKLRTMAVGAESQKLSLVDRNEMSGPVFKIRNDPRVTRIGRLLRKYSVDEIPQLVNVLVGHMSLVGPRPPLPTEVDRYEPWQRRKLSVKPGLTCLWQVNGRNAIDFDHWMELDLRYIDQWSLALDARILAQTIPAVLKGSGS